MSEHDSDDEDGERSALVSPWRSDDGGSTTDDETSSDDNGEKEEDRVHDEEGWVPLKG